MFNKNINILIVEDEIFASKYLAGILKKFGYQNIFDATSAEEALAIVDQENIDLVFMDINIHGAIDGIQCSKLLNEKYFIPIIFTTAYKDSSTLEEASKSNIYSFISKPFEPHNIEAALLITYKIICSNSQEDINKNHHLIDLGYNQIYNSRNNTFMLDDVPIALTQKELNLIDFFCRNINNNLSYEIIKENVWNNPELSNSTVRDSISNLKKKLPNLQIDNIVKFGYILKK